MQVSNFCMCFEKLHLLKDSCSTSHKWHLYVDCFPLKIRYCEIIGRRNWDVRWARCLLARTSFSKWQILSSSAFIRTEVSQCVLKKMNTDISTRIQGHQSMNVADSHDPLDFLRNATSRPNFLTYAGEIGADIHGWQRVYSKVDGFFIVIG